MPELSRVGDLEVGQDLEFERRMQKVQRAGWAVMALVVLAALLGLFGTGLFSKAHIGREDAPLRLEYDRCLRYQAPQRLRVRLDSGAARQGKVRLWISDDYLERVQIARIYPQPEGVELGPDGQTFTFQTEDLTEPATVMFYVVPERVGSLPGRMRLVGGDLLSFRQFVYS
jgi:hypothetical protein